MTTISRFLDQDLACGSALRVTRVGLMRVWDDEPLVLCADVIMSDGSVLRYTSQDYTDKFGLIARDVSTTTTTTDKENPS